MRLGRGGGAGGWGIAGTHREKSTVRFIGIHCTSRYYRGRRRELWPPTLLTNAHH